MASNVNLALTDSGGGKRKKVGQTSGETAIRVGINGAIGGGTGGTGGSSGSGSSGRTTTGGVTTGGGSTDWGALLAQYDDTYNRSMQRIADAYNAAAGMYGQNLNSARDQINASYNASRGDVVKDSERALREAYINNMMNRRNLNQSMSALGLNGGAAESTLASMQNQYGNSRAGIEETRDNNLSDLLRLRDQNLATALQEYNSRMADLQNQRMQMENQADNISANARLQLAMANMNTLNSNPSLAALANLGTFNVDSGSYTTALKNLVNAQNAYEYANAEASNAYTPVSAQQAASAAGGTNYAKYLASQYGNDQNAIKNAVFSQVRDGGMDVDTMAQILSQLGIY